MRFLKLNFSFFIFLLLSITTLKAEDGYRLWLRYNPIESSSLLEDYRKIFQSVDVLGESSTMTVIREELALGLGGLLDQKVNFSESTNDGLLLIGNYNQHQKIKALLKDEDLKVLGEDGFIIRTVQLNNQKVILITGLQDKALLYGTFHLLKLLQTHQDVSNLQVKSIPKIKVRMLNHWDNLDRTVERGYAGFSIWNWHQLPDYIDQRYIDYARANASIGINGVSLTNVNANALILRPDYLEKVKALANVFRAYGIKVYLTARFSAPIELGKLETADPLNGEVQNWWNEKTKEIYTLIPDFGGFLVKANSEGQPGPQNYGRTHADGANLLAEAVKPFGGIVMWRAFVYSNEEPEDRHKQANLEFQPLDGKFKSNVLIQVKNGAIDFQPREPFHPLFGAMEQTPLMMEFQITQEYLGQGTHLVYLGGYYKEVLNSDTYQKGENSTVAKVINGNINDQEVTAMAGVSNIGTDRNWTSHTFGQANWYAFGRLAWDDQLDEEVIAKEWLKMTFSNNEEIVDTMNKIMQSSHEAMVNYMTPLGLHHIMAAGHHFGPGPWVDFMSRADWNCTYYHKADSIGVGFNRTSTGSDAISQYHRQVAKKFSTMENCPEEYLLWFHHVPWNRKMESGNILWDEICLRYQSGVEQVDGFLNTWNKLEGKIDKERFLHIKSLLTIQLKEAKWWRDSCISYFQTFSNLPIPKGVPQPEKDLEYYKSLSFPYAPGIRPRW
ncbi:MAG: alpha-glucuronidase [Flammeovirgaceae bacterium]|nr:alpha-glucuronidase [Flammeovirgaceae bacterium]